MATLVLLACCLLALGPFFAVPARGLRGLNFPMDADHYARTATFAVASEIRKWMRMGDKTLLWPLKYATSVPGRKTTNLFVKIRVGKSGAEVIHAKILELEDSSGKHYFLDGLRNNVTEDSRIESFR